MARLDEDPIFPVTLRIAPSGAILLADGSGSVVVFDGDTGGLRPRRVFRDPGATLRLAGVRSNSRTYLFTSSAGGDEGLFEGDIAAATARRIREEPWDSARLIDDDSVLAKRADTIMLVDLRENSDVPPLAVASGTNVEPDGWSVSANGVLVHGVSQGFQFRWYSRTGEPADVIGDHARWGNFAMTADGSRVVAARANDGASTNLWSIDVSRNVTDRVTFGRARDSDPLLHSDGRLAFTRGPGFNQMTTAYAVVGTQSPDVLFSDPGGVALDAWSPNGEWMVYHHRRGLPGADPGTLLARRLGSEEPPRAAARCEGGLVDEARLSPDGRWLAFNCDESGRNEIYIVPFLRPGNRLRVSVDGGVQANWRSDGRELYYLALNGDMMVANLTVASETMSSAAPEKLFATTLEPASGNEQYQVTDDGQRFLLREGIGGPRLTRVVINWPSLTNLARDRDDASPQ